MASSVNFAQNTYSGEVLNDLLTYTAQGNDTYKEGLIHIKSGIQFKYTIPTIQLGKVIQDNVPTPNLNLTPVTMKSITNLPSRKVIWYSVT